VKKILEQRSMASDSKSPLAPGDHSFFVTDDPEKFKKVGSRFLETEMVNVERVEI
jgi:hypothetical protein